VGANGVGPSALGSKGLCLAGSGQWGLGGFFAGLGAGHGPLDGGKDQSGRALDHFQALGEECGITVVQLDVVGSRVSCVEADALRDHKGNRLGLGLPYRFGGCSSALSLVQHLVRELVNQCAELFCLFLAGSAMRPP
jgi:hypothetical protein